MDSGNQPGDILIKNQKLLKMVMRMFMKYPKVIIRDYEFWTTRWIILAKSPLFGEDGLWKSA